ncbi:MAG: DUF4337 family protein [Sphingomonadales bacterium]|nr:DUF4337 family protein [Sphingomonadales bacterium]
MEATEAKELIDETIERLEQNEGEAVKEERRFRDRLSLLVGIFAVLLAVVHLVGAGLLRENVVDTIKASDTYNYMQAKKIRQVVLQSAAITAPAVERDRLLADAAALDHADAKRHGITQLQATADALEEAGTRAGEAGEHYEWAETALQMAIVLLSIAMIASSRVVATGACVVAGSGIVLAVATYAHALG